jgi:amylosucrase
MRRARPRRPGSRDKRCWAVCCANLFAGNLAGLRARIPYFKELGLTNLHLMPLFKPPMPENDGGYAVSSYREVSPALGSMPELADRAGELRRQGISLVVDFVFDHTSGEHAWARLALAGEAEHQDYYYMFPDRQMPAQDMPASPPGPAAAKEGG